MTSEIICLMVSFSTGKKAEASKTNALYIASQCEGNDTLLYLRARVRIIRCHSNGNIRKGEGEEAESEEGESGKVEDDYLWTRVPMGCPSMTLRRLPTTSMLKT